MGHTEQCVDGRICALFSGQRLVSSKRLEDEGIASFVALAQAAGNKPGGVYYLLGVLPSPILASERVQRELIKSRRVHAGKVHR